MITIKDIKDKYKEFLDDLFLYEHEKRKQLSLSSIRIKKEYRGSGIGTKIMSDIISLADLKGYMITLTPSKDFGASSISRLKEFYKRFGFVENKGRNTDFTISDTMYRKPKNNVVEEKYMKKNISILESLRGNRKLSSIKESVEIDNIITSLQNDFNNIPSNLKPPSLDSDLQFLSSSFKNIEELVQEIAVETDYQKRTDRVRMAYNLADKAFQLAHSMYHEVTGILNGIQMGDWSKSGSQDMMNMEPMDDGLNPIINSIHSLKEYLKQTMSILAQNM